jgi:hypothetical protein
MTIIASPTGPTSSRIIDAEDVDYEEVTTTGDTKAKDSDDSKAKDSERIDERPIKKESGVKKKDKSSSTLWAKILGVLFGILILGFVIIGILSYFGIGKDSTTSTSSVSTSITAGVKMPVTINGKDTVITVGEFFPVSYGAEKPKEPSFTFDSKKYGNSFQRGGGIDATLWKENGDGTKVSADDSLPISWGNDEIYTWSKTGQSGTTWFIMTKRE